MHVRIDEKNLIQIKKTQKKQRKSVYHIVNTVLSKHFERTKKKEIVSQNELIK